MGDAIGLALLIEMPNDLIKGKQPLGAGEEDACYDAPEGTGA